MNAAGYDYQNHKNIIFWSWLTKMKKCFSRSLQMKLYHRTMCITVEPLLWGHPFASEKWPFKRGGLLLGVEINTYMFRLTLSSGLSRGGGLSSGWPLKRCSTVLLFCWIFIGRVIITAFYRWKCLISSDFWWSWDGCHFFGIPGLQCLRVRIRTNWLRKDLLHDGRKCKAMSFYEVVDCCCFLNKIINELTIDLWPRWNM